MFRAALALPALAFLASAGALHAGTSATPTVIASGMFQSKESGLIAAGTFEIQQLDGKFSLVIKNDFKVSEGPDLFFTFNPLPAAKTTGSNAKTSALQVTPQLVTLKGAQTFDLPATFDITKYQSLLIHCWQYDHLYAAAVINVAATSVHAPAQNSQGLKKPNSRDNKAHTLIWTDGTGQRGTDANGRLTPPLGEDPFRK